MHKTVVLNAVGLTPALLAAGHAPRLEDFAARGRVAAIGHVLPAVTCPVQTTYLTGCWPADHGIVANGWYFRDTTEVRFWLQPDRLVQRPRIWDIARARDPAVTCANLFWWYNMHCSADYAVTPRPMYPADGRKIPDIYTRPADLRRTLQDELGTFPLFRFWGPAADISSTRWIAQAALRVDRLHNPTLTLIYLPHLDYGLQKHGPDPGNPAVAADLRHLDDVCGELIDHYETRCGARVIVLSEYGILPVSRPVHLNRLLRQHDLLRVRQELGRDMLDAGASRAFAVADHQVAHVYVNDPGAMSKVRSLLESTPGVAEVLDADGRKRRHLDHSRSGELIAVASPDSWFTYYFWLDDTRAPDYARTVDIHRKPGYDPVELFLDPRIRFPRLRIIRKLAARKLGFRSLLDVIGLDASLVRGSHGAAPPTPDQGPLCISAQGELLPSDALTPTDICGVILHHLFE